MLHKSCSRKKESISEGVARDLFGVMHANGFKEGIIVTVNGASSVTKQFINSSPGHPISIWDDNDLIKLQAQGTFEENRK